MIIYIRTAPHSVQWLASCGCDRNCDVNGGKGSATGQDRLGFVKSSTIFDWRIFALGGVPEHFARTHLINLIHAMLSIFRIGFFVLPVA